MSTAITAILLLALGATASPHKPEPRAHDAAIISGMPTAYTAPAAIPTGLFSSYYSGYEPTQTTRQPMPVISDPVSHVVYPLDLTSPYTVPGNDTVDPINYPPQQVVNANWTAAYAIEAISAIIADNTTGLSNCTKCTDSMLIAQHVAKANPTEVGDMLVELCLKFAYTTAASCRNLYNSNATGPILAQYLAYADVGGYDGQTFCSQYFTSPATCVAPPPTAFNATSWFAKPKPANAFDLVPAPSGDRIKVLHISDLHLDPRYLTGSEASCTSGLCCRYGNLDTASNSTVSPAPRFGAFLCDSPYSLIISAFEAIPKLAGKIDAVVFTGDLVSHDAGNQLSRGYVSVTEAEMYRLMKEAFGDAPVYVAMGNHDEYQQATDAPHAILPEVLQTQFSWNYDHLASLWEHEGWITEQVANASKAHYGAYSTVSQKGLKVITINTDFWYKSNYLNFINASDADITGMFRWLTDELQAAEDAGERVWMVGHVLSGWDGTNPLTNPTNLYYQIVERFSPHVIANDFKGHTHEDQFSIFYANNATVQNASTAVAVQWIAPSVVPLTNLNSGFRMYEVDIGDWNIYDAHTWYTNVSSFAALSETGPVWTYEYSTRDAYDPNNTWPSTSPLNATFFHQVTENMEAQPSLVELFTTHQGKTSVFTAQNELCNTTACQTAKVCYMRSASVAIARENCKTGYGSVQ